MSIFNPHKALPENMLKYRLKLLENNGYHLYYPYGRSLSDASEHISGTLREPLYDGWTFRVFLYAERMSHEAELKLGWESVNPDKWHIRIWISKQGTVTTNGNDSTGAFTAPLGVPAVREGDYYTLGIRHELPDSFRVLFNAERGSKNADKKRNMGNVKEVNKWHFKIAPGAHKLLAVDVSDEMAKFPKDGLNQKYYHDGFPMDVGSFGIFEMTYTGTDGMLQVAFSQPSGNDRFTTFKKTFLKVGETFLVYIRVTPTGWLVQASFQDQAALVLRPKDDRNVAPKFSSANIMRMYLEPAPLI